jgi:FlaA1/EpsC-like NDP-sugar epimerase
LLQNIDTNEIINVTNIKQFAKENNIFSAIRNNILGTENLIISSVKNKVKKFIFISSDKAVNPSTVMGATKRVGELLVLHYSRLSKSTQLATVRFGNIIGSSGSVIPIFINNIKNSENLIVNNVNTERYFMSSQEAAYLVTKCSQMMDSVKKIFRVSPEDLNLFFSKRNLKFPDNQGESRISLNILKHCGYS